MQINKSNYFEQVKEFGIDNLPGSMKKAHELIDTATKGGSDWNAYDQFKKAMDMQFEALSLLMSRQVKPEIESGPKKAAPKAKVKRESPARKVVQHVERKTRHEGQKRHAPKLKFPKVNVQSKDVELISPEIAFIKRFALLHGKTKNKGQVLSFIKSLQRAIVEKRISKSSKHSKLISEIQKQLIKTYEKMPETVVFKFQQPTLVKYLKIAGSESILPSVRFIKQFIGLQEKPITSEKAKTFYNRIVSAIDNKTLSTKDRYFKHIKLIMQALKRFADANGSSDSLDITEAQLSGLEGVLRECGFVVSGYEYEESYEDENELSGVDSLPPRNTILNSQEVINLKSEKLDFQGKWLDFIGNPSRGFTVMIYGKPKFGKSYLAVEFAGYLARNHGKVLYVAREEGFDDTLKQKLSEKNVAHSNLDVSDYLPENLQGYDFVFLDSVTRLELDPMDLDELERSYPAISFVYLFQTTKGGDSKGSNEFKHNVDVVVEVPEKGRAVQYGRYNQGGELQIF